MSKALTKKEKAVITSMIHGSLYEIGKKMETATDNDKSLLADYLFELLAIDSKLNGY